MGVARHVQKRPPSANGPASRGRFDRVLTGGACHLVGHLRRGRGHPVDAGTRTPHRHEARIHARDGHLRRIGGRRREATDNPAVGQRIRWSTRAIQTRLARPPAVLTITPVRPIIHAAYSLDALPPAPETLSPQTKIASVVRSPSISRVTLAAQGDGSPSRGSSLRGHSSRHLRSWRNGR